MNELLNKNFRLRNEITGDIEETIYTVAVVEQDSEIPDLIWVYLVSEYGDDNIEYEPKYDIYYAKITNTMEGLLA